MNKPQMDLNRPVSWSQIGSFEWDPEQWYQSYVLGNRTSSKEMEFGSLIDTRIQKDRSFLPTLPRYHFMQHRIEAKYGKLNLLGILDGLDPLDYIAADYKTGKKPWDKKRTAETGQLKFYALLLWLSDRIPPEKFRFLIHWLPTELRTDGTIALIEPCVPQTFETTITMKDLLNFGNRLNRVHKEMQRYAKNHS